VGARAPVPTGTGCSASTSIARTGSSEVLATGCEGIKPGWVRINFMWLHRDGRAEPPLSLHDVSYADGRLDFPDHHREQLPDTELASYLDQARRIVEGLGGDPVGARPPTTGVSEDFEHLRWFPLPHEVAQG
jgi:hypothetical protein